MHEGRLSGRQAVQRGGVKIRISKATNDASEIVKSRRERCSTCGLMVISG